MRIGIDAIALQGMDRRRGIGRVSANVLCRLLKHDPSAEFVIYSHLGLPDDLLPTASNAVRRELRVDRSNGERSTAEALDRTARENPDGLDWLLILSPLDQAPHYEPPAKPLSPLKIAAIVYDLIPFLMPERYLTDEGHARRFTRNLERLRHYDLLLAISESTKRDAERLLGLNAAKVVNIGSACDRSVFRPEPREPFEQLKDRGVVDPFVFSVPGADERKNWRGLIDAFALLPEALRTSRQLVLGCGMSEDYRERVLSHARSRGLVDRLVLAGELTDQPLRLFYQHCAAFCFPSFYEGFGLPIIEALSCGAAVVAANNSSQPEVVGDAGLLAQADDPADIAAKLARVLTDENLARDLRRRAVSRAEAFSWSRSADIAFRTMAEYRSASRQRIDRGHAPKPRIAVFSPFPPKGSGISDYIAKLIHELKYYYSIDLYHDSGYLPEPAIASDSFAAFDQRLFERNASRIDYRALLYQMGNSHYHKYIYEAILRRPGIVTLHDFGLPAFQWWYAHQPDSPPNHFRDEIAAFDPNNASEILASLDLWDAEPGNMQEACTRRGVYLNRRVFDRSLKVIVHSPWCLAEVRRLFPEQEHKVATVPMGGTVSPVLREERERTRRKFGLPTDALLIGSFGILHTNKMNVEALDAFATVVQDAPNSLYVFAGQDLGHGQAADRARELGLSDRVRFLGRQSLEDFHSLIGCVDLGVSLRLPPTNGETSAALLDLLGRGIPTIVTDVGTFSGYSDAVVRKVRWDANGPRALGTAFRELLLDRDARIRLGKAALEEVRQKHAWPIAAAGYARVIEDVARSSRDRARSSADRLSMDVGR